MDTGFCVDHLHLKRAAIRSMGAAKSTHTIDPGSTIVTASIPSPAPRHAHDGVVVSLVFELHGTPIPQTRMAPPAIIEALHILKDFGSRSLASQKRPLVNQLGLQRGEEAFHDGIV